MRNKTSKKIDGIIVLDKPKGISSNAALQQVKRLFNAKKAGHTGNLDPMATGVLPLCFGQATKVSSFLLSANKSYIARIHLGVQTNTGDTEGEIIKTCTVPALEAVQINSVLQDFIGTITQIPPMYSALKHQGQALYKLAAKGLEVERKARQITIFQLRLLSRNENELEIFVNCSKGTYIRVLAEDIAKKLDTVAHLTVLRRTVAEPFTLQQAFTLEALQSLSSVQREMQLLPAEQALQHLPQLVLNKQQSQAISYGQKINSDSLSDTVGNINVQKGNSHLIRLINDQGIFIGIGVLDDIQLKPKRLFLG